MDLLEDSYLDFFDPCFLINNQCTDSFWTDQSVAARFGGFPSEIILSEVNHCVESERESVEVEKKCVDTGKEIPRKRGRTGSCNRPGAKACREKLRREKLNDRFLDLSSVLDPGRPTKSDKPAILDDAIRVMNHLRTESEELKETNEKLQEEIKTLKAEKNELREEKLGLKIDKEKLEQQLKVMAVPQPTGFMPPLPAAYHPGAPNKMAAFPSYGYIPMWQYLPQSTRDTSQDHQLRPPAA